jgi:hypothetical protein
MPGVIVGTPYFRGGGGQTVGLRFDAFHRPRIVKTDERRHDQAQRQKPLENSGPLSATLRRKALGQIEWHHHANQTAADAL